MKTKSILEDSTITKRFLFPRDKHFPDPCIVQTKSNKLFCYKMMKYPDKKMLMVFHGSSEVVADYLDGFAQEIDKMGYNLFIAEYPGYSQSTGQPNLINILDEIPYIIEQCGIEPIDLVIFCRSLGTAYAMKAIDLYPDIKGLIIESGIADFYERLNRRLSPEDIETTEEVLNDEVLKYFNIEKSLKQFKGSTLIMHTVEDRIISVNHAKQNYKWANEHKILKLFKDGGHSDIQDCNRVEYFKVIKEFMEQC